MKNNEFHSIRSAIPEEELDRLDAYWRASNYLSVGQLYLLDNPLLKEPLKEAHIKSRLLGHWGTTPGVNFIYTHLNRLINQFQSNLLFILGPGHGAAALMAHTYLEGTYTEFYPHITRDLEGLSLLFKQFSYPGGVPSHASPHIPGSIHEGGELGYSLGHAYGAAFDNPDLVVACVVGDGEAETGPLACSWHSNKFLNPVEDGVVLPILHLNGYKISSPTYLARISHRELEDLFKGYGYKPFFVEGDSARHMHRLMAETLDEIMMEIIQIQTKARNGENLTRPQWPLLILKTPKGWSCPREIDGRPCEGSWRSHQIPIKGFENHPERVRILEEWLKSYHPEELFDQKGRLISSLQEMAPKGDKRMGCNRHANGGLLLKQLKQPHLSDYEIKIASNGKDIAESARILGDYLRDVMKLNLKQKSFRLFSPDENESNRLGAVFEVTDRTFNGIILPSDEHLSPNGRVMEVLSEHLCEGWLEGYLLTGRHGFFSCYEAFIHIVDSMFNQYAKWLDMSRSISWRKPIASLNYFLTSHVWRQDHNGFSHQNPGFVDVMVNKKGGVIRAYYPPDGNTLLSVARHCLASQNYVNVIIAGKQPALQYLNMAEAVQHCARGVSIWKWASNSSKGRGEIPDVVMVCIGDIPTMETLAAVDLLRQMTPNLNVRVVNVVDLMTLQPKTEHPHGLTDAEFNEIFTVDKPVIVAYHGYPWIIHRLIYRRFNHPNFHVRGYKEEGTTTTPFDMVVLNEIDRFHLVKDVARRLEMEPAVRAKIETFVDEKLAFHKRYIQEHGQDLPEVRDWVWPY